MTQSPAPRSSEEPNFEYRLKKMESQLSQLTQQLLVATNNVTSTCNASGKQKKKLRQQKSTLGWCSFVYSW